jgi:transmembrane sensor
MDKSSVSIFRQKKLFLPLFSIAVVMSINFLIFILPQPLVTQLHETADGEYLSVSLTPQITVELDERSAITATNSEPPSVELIKGNVYFDNKNAAVETQHLSVTVGDIRFLGRGASFSVETLRNGGSITIRDGQVEMNIDGQSRSVSAGQRIDFDKKKVTEESSVVGIDIAPWRR